MLDYGLRSNEAVLVECTGVMPNDHKLFSSNGTLVLTSQNILFVTTTVFGKVKDIDKHPLSDVKVYDDTAQVKLEEKFGESPILNIYLKDGQLSYTMYEKGKAKEFVNQLNKAVTGRDVEIVNKSAIPGAAFVGETLKGTANAFKSALGIKPKEPEKVAMPCTSCGATISGIKGTVIKCEYCGSSVKLE